MCKASAVGNLVGPGSSGGDGARISTGTMGDADGLEGAKSKIDIITSDKNNKTLILVSY